MSIASPELPSEAVSTYRYGLREVGEEIGLRYSTISMIARQEQARRETRMRGMKILSSFIGGRIREAMDRVTQEAQK